MSPAHQAVAAGLRAAADTGLLRTYERTPLRAAALAERDPTLAELTLATYLLTASEVLSLARAEWFGVWSYCRERVLVMAIVIGSVEMEVA